MNFMDSDNAIVTGCLLKDELHGFRQCYRDRMFMKGSTSWIQTMLSWQDVYRRMNSMDSEDVIVT